MAYSSKKSVVVEHPTKKQLKEDLAYLNLQISECESRIAEYTLTQEDIETAKITLESNKSKILEAEKELKEFNLVIKAKKEQIETLDGEIKSKQTEIAQLEREKAVKIDNETAELNRIALEITAKTNKLKNVSQLEIDIKNKEDWKIKLTDEVDKLKGFKDNFGRQVEETAKKLSDVRLELNKQYEDKIKVDRDLESAKSALAEVNKTLSEKESRINDLIAEYTRKELELVNRLSDIETKKEAEWSKKSGDLSLKETWLKEKEGKLRKVKTEMEKKLNKKIEVII